jgi:cytochrome c556
MKRVFAIACVFSLALVGTAIAQAPPASKSSIASEADYSAAMKEIGQTNGMIGKALQGGNTADATKGAARLETLFRDVHAYWQAKKVDDATKFAADALAASQAMSKALAAGDVMAATDARTKLGAQCMGCHTAHREKTESGFKMK